MSYVTQYFFFLLKQSLMKTVYKMPLPMHLLNCFFLVFSLLLSYLSRLDFSFPGYFWGLCPTLSLWLVPLWGGWPHGKLCYYPFLLDPFNVNEIFVSVHLDYFANLLPFVISLDNLKVFIPSNGHRSNIVLLSQLFQKVEGGEDMIFLQMWEGALQCCLWFFLWSEVTKWLNLILATMIQRWIQKEKKLNKFSNMLLKTLSFFVIWFTFVCLHIQYHKS